MKLEWEVAQPSRISIQKQWNGEMLEHKNRCYAEQGLLLLFFDFDMQWYKNKLFILIFRML